MLFRFSHPSGPEVPGLFQYLNTPYFWIFFQNNVKIIILISPVDENELTCNERVNSH